MRRDVPNPELLDRIAGLLGMPLTNYRTIQGGYSLALRLRCETAHGSVFVKVGHSTGTSAALRREIAVYQRISGPFMPRVIAWDADEDSPILVIEDLSSATWPPPWNQERVERVLAQIDTMHAIMAPIETYAEILGAWQPCWPGIAADPAAFLALGLADVAWLERALPALIQAEAGCETAGNALCHWDLRSDNLCLAADQVVFVDWNHACLSNARLDLGFFLPSLAAEGGPLPDAILPHAPEVAAWVAGYFAARAGLPPVAEAPTVRAVQRRQLETALAWAVRALGLSPV